MTIRRRKLPVGVLPSIPAPPAPASFFSTANARTQRETLRTEHTIGTGEGGFTGFASRTGFTTQTVTSATALVTAMNAMATTDKIIFKCQWNGVSNPASYGISGPSNASMTANGAVDWGYTRPAWSAIVEPATGFTPTIGITTGTLGLSVSGTHWHEFNDMTFTGDIEFFPTTGFRNGIAVIAMNRCNIQGSLTATGVRTLHMDGCTTSGAGATLLNTPNYYRVWNHKGILQTNALDFCHNFGFSGAYTAAWVAHTWFAGCILQKMVAVTSGNHFDWLQQMLTGDPVLGYHTLVEFCTVNANSEDSQGIFIANIVPGQANAYCIHNSIFAVNAYWAAAMCDPSGTQICIADRLLCMRGGIGPGPTAPVFDTTPYVGVTGNGINAGGSMAVTSSYFWKAPTTEVQNNNCTVPITVSGNVHMDPRLTALTASKPQTLLTGNGTWATNASGFTSFTSPDIAISDPVAANAAFLAFAKPVAGWGVVAGPVDPATWPTNFNQTLA